MNALEFKNIFRWIKENLIVWVLLVAIYSVVTTIVLDAVFQIIFKYETKKLFLWSILFTGLLSSFFFEWVSIPSNLKLKLDFIKNPYARIYMLHDLRRWNGWLFAFLLGVAAYFLGKIHVSFILLLYLLVVQRPLFSLWKWRRLFVSFQPLQAAQGWYLGVFYTQIFYTFLFFLPMLGSMTYLSATFMLKTISGCLGGLCSSLAVSFEGDSGTPVMVNLITFTAGVLGSFLSFYSPWALILGFYFWISMRGQIQNRFLSVEKLDEDFIIS